MPCKINDIKELIMPKINAIKSEITNLKKKLEQEPAGKVDITFDENTDFSFDTVRSDTDQKKGEWVGVTVKLYNYLIGEETGGSGALGNDDVQYVGICKCPSPRAVHTDEYEDLEEKKPVIPDRRFGAYSPLDQKNKVRFGVFCNAYNNDSGEAWEGIVAALKGDLTKATDLGLSALPGLSQFKSPGAVAKGLTGLISDALTDRPVEVSGDEIICDTVHSVKWFRTIEQSKWTARKWFVHTLEDKKAWYLSQWFITLDTDRKRYDYAGLPPSNYFVSLENNLVSQEEVYTLAALEYMKGIPILEVAENFNINTLDVMTGYNALRSSSSEEAIALVHSALIKKNI